jgi:hypothetical protein
MTDEVRFALHLGLSLIAILIAGWLAGRIAVRRVQKVLAAERQRLEETRRQAQAEVMANLPSVPAELEHLVEIERWVLTARELQQSLKSTGILIKLALRAEGSNQQGISTEIDRSLKFLSRQENKWLGSSLSVVAHVRQLDPAKGKARNQSLETWISRLNQAYVQASQSLRRAASLCSPDAIEAHADTMAKAYLAEADQAASNMISMVASAFERLAHLKQQLPEHQARQIEIVAAEQATDSDTIFEEMDLTEGTVDPIDPSATLVASRSRNAA